MAARLTVIGVGNASRRDDGAGLLAARGVRARLATAPGADAVDIRECAGEATALMDAWTDCDQVIIVDAVYSGADPGTIHRLDAHSESVPHSFLRASSHSFGVAEAIELARVLGKLPRRVVVYGVEGREFGYGDELSAAARAAVARAVEKIVKEIHILRGASPDAQDGAPCTNSR